MMLIYLLLMNEVSKPSGEALAPPAREHRQRVFKGASILLGIKASEIACMLRNMHAHGAELKVPIEQILPERFLLYVPVDGVAYRCRLCWRKNDRAGIAIEGTEPKPHWHYG